MVVTFMNNNDLLVKINNALIDSIIDKFLIIAKNEKMKKDIIEIGNRHKNYDLFKDWTLKDEIIRLF